MNRLLSSTVKPNRLLLEATNQQLRNLNHANGLCLSPSKQSGRQQSDKIPEKKPNLRRAGKNNQNLIMIAVGCVMFTIYMYPMIIKPMLATERDGDEKVRSLQQAGIDFSKSRPSNMPEWSSPYGPKGGDKSE